MKNLYKEIFSRKKDKIAIISNNQLFSYQNLHNKVDIYSNMLSKINCTDYVGIECRSLSNYISAIYACFKQNKIAIPLLDKERSSEIKKNLNLKVSLNDKSIYYLKKNIEKNKNSFSKIALILYTSGTTSKFLKGVRLSHNSVSHVSSYMNSTMKINSNTVENIFAPLDHAFALGRIHSILTAGGTIILPKNFLLIKEILKDISKHKCNAIASIPLILESILKLDDESIKLIKNNIKYMQIGSMKLSFKTRKKILKFFPKTKIYYHYGMTEAMRTTFIELGKNKKKINTEGKPIKGVSLKIVSDKNIELKKNKIGRICIKGKNLFTGYVNQNFDKKWFLTSDIGYLDSQNYLVYKGRIDEVVNLKGKLINLIELEEKIKNILNRKITVLNNNEDLFLVIEGDENKTDINIIRDKLYKYKFLLNNLYFIKKIPLTKTMKVPKKHLLGKILNERI